MDSQVRVWPSQRRSSKFGGRVALAALGAAFAFEHSGDGGGLDVHADVDAGVVVRSS
jgi:hypothetical protein